MNPLHWIVAHTVRRTRTARCARCGAAWPPADEVERRVGLCSRCRAADAERSRSTPR